ncbi:hypothetical protein Sme01_65840 [Sphaerisporangium melleum]|uniref:Alpha-amylase n=1 Tax=Sphaerisporangium melleum TaxID=321316 RepID=A0A917VQJ7_9ACTN|nr:S8 family serine peptidase [Sphaerisporangium melleum]GGL04578.1 hypothetical protein GCM10007964_53430 [Sphaerisporangium melleum]GII74108.1 hypothetical protein Sme01_65840 [Sphaerisporangium melleum]
MSISRLWRAALIGTTSLALFLPQSVAYGATPAAGPGSDKINRVVTAELSADGKATFWVRLKDRADLRTARTAKTKSDKGRQVYRAKTQTATASQANLRKLLKARHADFTPFWIVNTIKVTGDAGLAADIAALPEVASIEPDQTSPSPDPQPGVAQAATGNVEWNVDRINAPKVWNELGDRGEGVVIASLDTGVQWDHPALKSKYRGTRPDGTADHNYNWYDPEGWCPAAEPCDDRGHGTHTIGTMVGDDGEGNGIGVAPGATFISIKGCGSSAVGCTRAATMAGGQWILAPTDLNGQNPRPDLAPDIVNNSWGGSGIDLFYKDIVEAWVAAGIFPAWSNGNEGPSCGTTGTPGGYIASYSAGAADVNGRIAYFSSRGEGEDGEIKPNITAPGVDIRSAVPGGGYALKSGTSMASPHVAATVALMWAASPYVKNDVALTRELLDRTAADVDDQGCGGTAGDNFVYGEGMLDAYAAVQATPAGEFGTLTGTVTSGGSPLEGVTVKITGPLNRTVTTGQDGSYSIPRLIAGDYQITAGKFTYDDATATVTVGDGSTATKDLSLTPQEMGTVSGTVSSVGLPESGATVRATGTPASTVTDAQGRYELRLPRKAYDLAVTAGSPCAENTTVPVTVTAALTQDIELTSHIDSYGYTCKTGTEPYIEGTERQPLNYDDEYQNISLPFAFPFYGRTYTSGMVSTNGFLSFGDYTYAYPTNESLPSADGPNAGVYPFWDDMGLFDFDEGHLYTATIGTAPNRTFVVEWRNARFYSRDELISYEALLGEDGSVGFRYRGISSDFATGEGATIGIENADGTDAFQYSHLTGGVLRDGQSITIAARGHGLVAGTVTDANDRRPVAGATVQVGDVATFTTGADGAFLGQVPAGDFPVEVSAGNYGTVTKDVTVAAGRRTTLDTALTTGRVTASTGQVTLVMPAGATRTGGFELSNPGATAAYTIEVDPAAKDWLGVTPAGGEVAAGGSVRVRVTASSAGVRPGTVRTGTLTVRSASGRTPAFPVTVSVVVPKVQVALEAGGGKKVTDAAGDIWTPDREYSRGGYGYVGAGHASSTGVRIAGTTEQALFASAREGMREYRFDGVPDGVYTVELGFAEIHGKRPGKRVFDVTAEGRPLVTALDVAKEAGQNTALTRQYTVKVTDGRLDVCFTARAGEPIVNAIRVTERPDKTAG